MLPTRLKSDCLNSITVSMDKIRSFINIIFLMMIVACSDKQPAQEAAKETPAKDTTLSNTGVKTILFFGNSLTAGYGVELSEAFPSLIQNKIDSLGLQYKTVNAGVSGETSSGGNARIDWILRQPLHVFVLELGANDGLRGIPANETKKNLQAIIDKVNSKYPEAKLVLAGMQIPPNMGQQYASQFKDIFPELAQKNKITLIPFLLQGVGGEVRYNQNDGIHPTPEGHKIVAENVWKVLKDVL